MASDKDWAYLRACLNDIKDKYKDTEDPDLINLTVVIDLFLLSTYMPHTLHDLYKILDKHLGDSLGGQN